MDESIEMEFRQLFEELSDELQEVRDIVEAIRSGLPDTPTEETATAIEQPATAETPSTTPDNDIDTKLVDLFLQKLSYQQIADTLGLSKSFCYRRLKQINGN